MDTVPVSLEVLQTLFGKTPQELQSALMIESEGKKIPADQTKIDNYVTEAQRARLTEMKGTGTDQATSGGKKLAFDEVEKYLHDNFGIQAKGDYKKAISEAIDSAKTKAQTSEEAVKGSDHYKEVIAKLEAKENELKSTKTDFRSRIVKDKFQREVRNVLSDKSLLLALPENESILDTQLEAFSSLISAKARLQLNDDDVIVPVDANGKQLQDQNYNDITLKSFITSNAKSFWPTQANGNGRTSPPAGQQTGQPAAPPDGTKFPKFGKDAEKFTAFLDQSEKEGKDSKFMKEALVAFESETT